MGHSHCHWRQTGSFYRRPNAIRPKLKFGQDPNNPSSPVNLERRAARAEPPAQEPAERPPTLRCSMWPQTMGRGCPEELLHGHVGSCSPEPPLTAVRCSLSATREWTDFCHSLVFIPDLKTLQIGEIPLSTVTHSVTHPQNALQSSWSLHMQPGQARPGHRLLLEFSTRLNWCLVIASCRAGPMTAAELQRNVADTQPSENPRSAMVLRTALAPGAQQLRLDRHRHV